ncbi:MAG: DUF3108 domain-containing protein [Bryobacteraceae bacterium]
MKFALAIVIAFAASAFAAEKAVPVATPAPALHDESLHYVVNWPSGLSLGECQFAAHRLAAADGQPSHWDFQLNLDAAVPGFEVHDQIHSTASPEFCSSETDKNYVQGKRKAEEKITFDPHANTATRETLNGGGKSDVSTPACAKDPLAYLAFLRHELVEGRLPPPQPIVFGAVYRIRVVFAGAETVKVGGKPVETDHLTATLKGPSSDVTFDIFFARDAVRTPVLVRVPLSLAAFTMELAR